MAPIFPHLCPSPGWLLHITRERGETRMLSITGARLKTAIRLFHKFLLNGLHSEELAIAQPILSWMSWLGLKPQTLLFWVCETVHILRPDLLLGFCWPYTISMTLELTPSPRRFQLTFLYVLACLPAYSMAFYNSPPAFHSSKSLL